MRSDKVVYNGNLCSLADIDPDVDKLLEGNYVYQQIHVTNYRALHLPVHIEIVRNAFGLLYGKSLDLSEKSLQADIEQLFRANSYREMSYSVRLYVFEDGYMLSCCKQLLYCGYVMWHSRPAAIITQYENPFAGCANASSLISATFASQFAKRSGVDVALTENYDHILVGVGDNPLFALHDDTVCITPIKYGAIDSVERRMGIKAAYQAGYEVTERPLLNQDIPTYQELFTIDTQGVVSIFNCGRTTFFNIAAERIAKFYSESR